MDYVKEITVPANTAEINAQLTDLIITDGIIVLVRIQFPPGCQGTAHVQVWDGARQLWPTNPESDYAEDAVTLKIQASYPVEEKPYLLRIRTWNDDTANDHTVRVGVNMLPLEPTLLSRFVQAVMGRPRRLGGL